MAKMGDGAALRTRKLHLLWSFCMILHDDRGDCPKWMGFEDTIMLGVWKRDDVSKEGEEIMLQVFSSAMSAACRQVLPQLHKGGFLFFSLREREKDQDRSTR
jgi:hypothetical protein